MPTYTLQYITTPDSLLYDQENGRYVNQYKELYFEYREACLA